MPTRRPKAQKKSLANSPGVSSCLRPVGTFRDDTLQYHAAFIRCSNHDALNIFQTNPFSLSPISCCFLSRSNLHAMVRCMPSEQRPMPLILCHFESCSWELCRTVAELVQKMIIDAYKTCTQDRAYKARTECGPYSTCAEAVCTVLVQMRSVPSTVPIESDGSKAAIIQEWR